MLGEMVPSSSLRMTSMRASKEDAAEISGEHGGAECQGGVADEFAATDDHRGLPE
jgi:hypothetical protein